MGEVASKIISILDGVTSSGAYISSGVQTIVMPGLEIQGVGEIGLPLSESQAKAIKKASIQAPFGKGSQTVTDTNIRSAREIDASQLTFNNPEWDTFLSSTLKKVKKDLGLESKEINASLYKLLLYEKGDFFLPHKDSEKEEGMFGTLVIALPSKHEGGELLVRFGGETEEIDFSVASSNYQISFAAFYADCEHEIKPVQSGYRLCLVYNLVQVKGQNIQSPDIDTEIEAIVPLLEKMENSFSDSPKIILLGHEYTPANFSKEQLKLHDRPRAEILLKAAEQAGYFARLGLLTCYQMGDLESDYDYYSSYRGRRRYYEEEPSEGTMGDIHEEYNEVVHWGEDGLPPLGNISILETDIITNIALKDGDPTEQEEEGYTGNAGMTIEYWYHYGAVVLWPRSKHTQFLGTTGVGTKLGWLDFYNKHWENKVLESQRFAKNLLAEINLSLKNEDNLWSYRDTNFDMVIDTLLKVKDDSFIKKNAGYICTKVFNRISVDAWIRLLDFYSTDRLLTIFEMVTDTEDVDINLHLLQILQKISVREKWNAFITSNVVQFPTYFKKIVFSEVKSKQFYYQTDNTEVITKIVAHLIPLSKFNEGDEVWLEQVLALITKNHQRKFVNEILVPIIINENVQKRSLTQKLLLFSLQDLMKRTKVKPSPPSDWIRSVPSSRYYANVWELLKDFLESPTQRVFEYRAKQSYRNTVVSAIKEVTIDLKYETIKKGSPHTLKITKTQNDYDLKLKNWKEDMVLLEKVENVMI